MLADRQIRSVGVVGGGSAGYLAALYLKKIHPELEVTVIESTRIPVVGVGEATTQTMLNFLHGLMGFPVGEFIAQARPTLKLGVKLHWGRRGFDHYNNTFGPIDLQGALAQTGDLNNSSLLSMLMEGDKTPFVRVGEKVVPKRTTLAYHIDNKHFLSYLRGKLAVLSCVHLDTEIADVKLTPDGAAVDRLITTGGVARRFDLYLDCSGFRSLLLGSALGAEWVDYAASLKTDRAVLGMRENSGEIAPYTTAATLNHGWLWNTPMRHEDHLGYVFSSSHCSDDEALRELEMHCSKVVSARVVKFRTGRYDRSWSGNVVAVGNAYAFIEPLESTGLHMILMQLKAIAAMLGKQPVTDEMIGRYNRRIAAKWDHLRWFVAMHFRFNGKLDTPFWQDCRREADVSGIAAYIDFFERNGPLSSHPDHPLYEQVDQDAVFSVFAHDANLAGCGVNRGSFLSAQRVENTSFSARYAIDRRIVESALGQRESLQYLESNEVEFVVGPRGEGEGFRLPGRAL